VPLSSVTSMVASMTFGWSRKKLSGGAPLSEKVCRSFLCDGQ